MDPRDWPYDQSYFAKYKGYEDTSIGRNLTRFRILLARAFGPRLPLIDVGIGAGTFVEALVKERVCEVYGYDVNPAGAQWLDERGWFRPIELPIERMTFWDSLEHIADPKAVLTQCKQFAFISMPIYRDESHARASKHFKPDEHYWYFTEDGLITYMDKQGFDLVYAGDMETVLGREDIGTFVFMRRG